LWAAARRWKPSKNLAQVARNASNRSHGTIMSAAVLVIRASTAASALATRAFTAAGQNYIMLYNPSGRDTNTTGQTLDQNVAAGHPVDVDIFPKCLEGHCNLKSSNLVILTSIWKELRSHTRQNLPEIVVSRSLDT
jgi:ribosomal protein L35